MTAAAEWADGYAAALADYLAAPSEEGLTRGYELGRCALALGVAIGEVVAVHARAISPDAAVQRAADFLGETLAPYEMGLRGYREANAQLKHLNADLERRVEERSAALREADRRKDEFLATLAHELRNPLAPIRNAVQVLHLSGGVNPELAWARDVIDRQMRQMARLLDDLLDVSRISQGKLVLQRERVALSAVVREAVEACQPLLAAMRHDLSVALPDEPILLDVDPTRLAQVLLNLLNNAAKYTDPGGRIALRAERGDGDVAVSVLDNGIGLAADKLPIVFDLFAQVGDAITRSQGGLGIGLALVRRLVEMHGGSIVARSAGPGQGCEFVVRLPTVAGVPVPDGAVPEQKPTGPLRVLVVDDNRDAADSLAMLLQMVGNEVRTAHDGEEAIRAAAEFQPDVVLCDIGLPRVSGHDAARAIRREAWGQAMVLIAVTGWGQDADRKKSAEAGFDRHLVKPVDPKALMELLAGLRPGPAAK